MTPTQPYYTVLQLSKIIQASKLDTELSNKWLLPEYSPRKQEVPEDVQPVDLSLKKKPEETGNKTVPPEAENGLYALHEADNSLQAPPEAVNGLHGCDVCGKRYSTSSNLHRHRQVHREERTVRPGRVPSVVKSTFPCQLTACTSELILKGARVKSAGKVLVDLGYFKVISELIRGRSHSNVINVTKRLRINLTCALTLRLTPQINRTNVWAVTKALHWKVTCINTRRPHACEVRGWNYNLTANTEWIS